jgi:Flp pilus assembly protein TadG
MTSPILSRSRTFSSDERGVVAILFGLSVMVLVLLIGIAVDQARVYHSTSKLAAAADAAALAAGRAMLDGNFTDAEIAAIGEKFFSENLSANRDFTDVHGVRVIPNQMESTIRVEIDADVPMTFTRVAGFNAVATPTNSLTSFEPADLELGMALDITGSMEGQKLEDLKAAAKDLIEVLLPGGDQPNKVRIGLAPYSASIRLGSYASTVSNGASRDGCVRERTGASANTDDEPASGAYYRAGRSSDIDPTQGSQDYFCPAAAIVPLTDDKDALNRSIDGYVASGATAGHIGAQWAWNLISPNYKRIWPTSSEPVAYNDGKTTKAVILMTDGIFNMSYANGRASDQALAICGGLGAPTKNVKVYTVAFDAPAFAKTLLEDCAEAAGGEFFDATDGEALRSAFLSIAKNLNDLRLTQ